MARKFTIDDWQQRLNKLKQPLIIIDKRTQKNSKRELFKLQCYKCGGTFEVDRKAIKTACILREKGKKDVNWCPYCNDHRILKGFNDVATIRYDLMKYFVNKQDAENYGVGSNTRVLLICPKCKQTKTIRIADLCAHGFHCDYCNDNVSLGEKMIRNLLLQLPIEDYDYEFTDKWTLGKRYDVWFVYQGVNYLIEVDGEQHIKNTSWSTKEWQEKNDALKTKLAKKNGFELIRIKAYKTDFEYIKQNILKSQLGKIFDLSNIDWEKILNQTITSDNLLIAQYYREHPNLMMKDIAEHFHISYPTLSHTLEKMAQIGVCDYSKEKTFRNGRRLYGIRRKKGEVT